MSPTNTDAKTLARIHRIVDARKDMIRSIFPSSISSFARIVAGKNRYWRAIWVVRSYWSRIFVISFVSSKLVASGLSQYTFFPFCKALSTAPL